MNNKNNLFTYTKEYIKSKIDSNYVLSSDSPERMLNNHDLLIKTIKQNPKFIEELPEEILFKDDAYIKTAIEAGYRMKTGDNKFKNNSIFISKYLDFCTKLPEACSIELSVFNDQEIREKFLSRAKQEKYSIRMWDPQFLKDDPELAIEYFRNLIRISGQSHANIHANIFGNSILSKELMKNDWFIKEFINLCAESGISEHEIIDLITTVGINK